MWQKHFTVAYKHSSGRMQENIIRIKKGHPEMKPPTYRPGSIISHVLNVDLQLPMLLQRRQLFPTKGAGSSHLKFSNGKEFPPPLIPHLHPSQICSPWPLLFLQERKNGCESWIAMQQQTAFYFFIDNFYRNQNPSSCNFANCITKFWRKVRALLRSGEKDEFRSPNADGVVHEKFFN